MPQILLEYTSNLNTGDGDLRGLLLQVHKALERANIGIGNCKSRAVKREIFCVGDGEDKNAAFAHVDVASLASPEKTDEWKGLVSTDINNVLQKFFLTDANAHLEVQVTVKFSDLNLYVKHRHGKTSTIIRPSNAPKL